MSAMPFRLWNAGVQMVVNPAPARIMSRYRMGCWSSSLSFTTGALAITTGMANFSCPASLSPSRKFSAPVDHLLVGVVRASDVDRRRVALWIQPKVLKGIANALVLSVVDHIGLVIVNQQITSLVDRFGRHVLHVIQPNGAARGSGGAHGLQLAHRDPGSGFPSSMPIHWSMPVM